MSKMLKVIIIKMKAMHSQKYRRPSGSKSLLTPFILIILKKTTLDYFLITIENPYFNPLKKNLNVIGQTTRYFYDY